MVDSDQPNNTVSTVPNRSKTEPGDEPFVPGKSEEPGIVESVKKTMQDKSSYVTSLLEDYKQRKLWRAENGIPVIALCGYGKAGKDMSARHLCQRTGMEYGGSTSSIAAPLIAHALGVEVEIAFMNRRNQRDFWYEFCCEMRRDDPTLLAKMSLGLGDIVVGPRDDFELFECKDKGVVDLTVWIERPELELTEEYVDPTVKFGPEDCDLVLYNAGSRFNLLHRLDKMLELLRTPYFPVSYRNSSGDPDHGKVKTPPTTAK